MWGKSLTKKGWRRFLGPVALLLLGLAVLGSALATADFVVFYSSATGTLVINRGNIKPIAIAVPKNR